MAPALLSLVLFIREEVLPLVLAIDGIVAFVALIDLASLVGAGRLRVEPPGGPGLFAQRAARMSFSSIENAGRRARSLRLRATTYPTNSRRSPRRLTSRCLVQRQCHASSTSCVPKRRGTYVFEQVDALDRKPPGILGEPTMLLAATNGGSGLSQHSPGRAVQPMLRGGRDRLSTMGAAAAAHDWARTTSLNGCGATTSKGQDDPRHLDLACDGVRRRKLTCRAFQANQSQRIMFLIDCGG